MKTYFAKFQASSFSYGADTINMLMVVGLCVVGLCVVGLLACWAGCLPGCWPACWPGFLPGCLPGGGEIEREREREQGVIEIGALRHTPSPHPLRPHE